MRNIIKALNYQVKTDNVTYYTIAFMLLAYAGIFLLDGAEWGSVTGSMIVAFLSGIYPYIIPFIILIIGVRICGWDFEDKTINYEILSGHKRSEIFFARVITALVWCVSMCFAFMLAPVLVFTIINGWDGNGMAMSFGDAAACFAMSVFPIIRIVCQYIFLTFLLKSANLAWFSGYLLSMLSMGIPMLFEELSDFRFTYHLASTNFMELFKFNQSMGYVNGEDVSLFESMLEPSLVCETIVVSLTVSAVCLALGYVLFRKRDTV